MLNDFNFSKKDGKGGADAAPEVDLCPKALEEEIDAMNEFVYEKVMRPFDLVLGIYGERIDTGRRSAGLAERCEGCRERTRNELVFVWNTGRF